MTPAPRAILFDLDETILTFGRRLDQLIAVAQGFVDPNQSLTAEALAVKVDGHLTAFWSDQSRLESLRGRMIEARHVAVSEAFAELSAAGAGGLSPDAARRFAEAFHALRVSQIRLFPGAFETLDALRAAGVRMALITNGPSEIQRAKIDRFDLARRFHHVQVEGECGFGKPDPRAYHHALAAIDAAPHEAWIVGDNLEWEVAAPQRLGIHAIWCDPYRAGLPSGGSVTPDRIIHALSELTPPF